MIVLAVTGLSCRRIGHGATPHGAQLRLHQELLARVARLGSVGELATAVAHEVNQPLMAAGTYIRLVADSMRSGKVDPAEVAETAKKAVAQIDRAAEVIRRLWALVRLDRSNRIPVRFERIVKGMIELCKPDLDQAGVTARSKLAADLPPVLVDVLQIEQVLSNLMRNSIEAISDSGGTKGRFGSKRNPPTTISSRSACLIPAQAFRSSASKWDPFLYPPASPTDLALGYRYVTSILEAHGGRLWLEQHSDGASVRFTLPIAK